MIERDQHVFNLADRRIARVDLAANQFARPGASGKCRIINAEYRCSRLRLCGTLGLRLLSMGGSNG
jgi:hypothetical protein